MRLQALSTGRLGTLRAELGRDVHHCVAFGTNYTREGINSKIVENYRTDNRSLVQLTAQTTLCRRGLSSIPGLET